MKKQIAWLAIVAAFFILTENIRANPDDSKKETAAEKKKLSAAEVSELAKRATVQIKDYLWNGYAWTENASGSGFFLDEDGHVATNAHVVKDDTESWNDGPRSPRQGPHANNEEHQYLVILSYANKAFEAKLLGCDRYRDTALLEVIGIKKEEYNALPTGDAYALQKGNRVYAIGTPHGLIDTVTEGIVSGLHRSIDPRVFYLEDDIQHSAPVNPGNSGGPLLNEYGEIVGINHVGYNGADGLGLALPIYLFNKVKLMAGEVGIPYLGAGCQLSNPPPTPWIDDLLKIRDATKIRNLATLVAIAKILAAGGALVEEVDDDSPAKAVTLRPGDVITKWNGVPIKDGMALRFSQAEAEAGQPVEIDISRVNCGEVTVMKLVPILTHDGKN